MGRRMESQSGPQRDYAKPQKVIRTRLLHLNVSAFLVIPRRIRTDNCCFLTVHLDSVCVIFRFKHAHSFASSIHFFASQNNKRPSIPQEVNSVTLSPSFL
mmetsp:Transcript_2278/g.8454  ORF Transcript_2278/g.8454 Transcript_2278/m.8454 type:complete len:100 (+) Transcript_2278:1336-1635(+)